MIIKIKNKNFKKIVKAQKAFLSQISITLIRWALIAGRIPGRTAEEIEKYWTTRCSTSE